MRQSQPRTGHSWRHGGSTPPDDGVQLLLTPPATDERLVQKWDVSEATDVDKVMQLFEASHTTLSQHRTSLTEFRISPRQYQELGKRLGEERELGQYVDDKVRFDYDPENSLLTIRMPSPVHDFFTNLLAIEIRDQLKEIAERADNAGDFAGKIEVGGSSRIFLREGITDESLGTAGQAVRREPDGQFQHPDAAYPGVVIEVSYSQDGKDLKKLASDYILRSNGDIKVVLGIDINYGEKSTVSVWRPHYVEEEGEELELLEVRPEVSYQPFRSASGSPVGHEETLKLSLSDFATDEISSGYGSVHLSISFRQLADFLARAELMRQTREPESESRGIKSRRQTRKRRPSSSPADELRSEDEAKYRRQEMDAAERAAAGDGEYERPRRRQKK
ncbi:hypothetical protein QBC34DRAFT_411313 [Podospora aff. communis PSN243]|uniref:Uncharacterized protein n=1 Tax=Podospora aff. communis PSN243 TaxID=3040156 RepID=A0AAV9GE58_9PEZI|nr:hypothetical protein QBC34DRAFT_411313 [Podospora aff. communis PSN243]